MKRMTAKLWAGAVLIAGFAIGGCASSASADPGTPTSSPAAADTAAPKAFDAPPPVGTKATCPVMGGEFVVGEQTERSTYKGKHYVFCCGGCKPQFDADPGKFVGG
jgi:YHS domain-containing protein